MRMFDMALSFQHPFNDLVGVVHENQGTIHDVVRAQIRSQHDAVLGQVAAAAVDSIVAAGNTVRVFLSTNFKPSAQPRNPWFGKSILMLSTTEIPSPWAL